MADRRAYMDNKPVPAWEALLRIGYMEAMDHNAGQGARNDQETDKLASVCRSIHKPKAVHKLSVASSNGVKC